MRARGFLIAASAALLLYLAAWPVPVDPESWTPPPAPPLSGPYESNTRLANVERLELAGGSGPEDVDVDAEGRVYAGLADGRIIRMRRDGSGLESFAHTGGRPLGLEFDALGNLLVADAVKGLLSVSPGGEVTLLAAEAAGIPIRFADDVDVAADGTVYFSDASTKFPIADNLLDIIESRPNGRLLAWDPASGACRVLIDRLHFANGVAVSPDGTYVLVNETSRYRIVRYWLEGPRRGESEVFVDNLPGFPDGISSGGQGVYWVALISPRNRLLDSLGPYPFLRKVLVRLPEFVRPAAERYGFVLGIGEDGRVAHNLQDPAAGRYALISSVEQHGSELYLGSLEEQAVGRIPLPSSPD